jgi:hypothetical protein
MFKARLVLIGSTPRLDQQAGHSHRRFSSRGRGADGRYFMVNACIGAATFGLAVLVSFLAVSYTSEARAPGISDEGAALSQDYRPLTIHEPNFDYGPTSIYLEPALVLALKTYYTDPAEIPAILANAPRNISPPPPQAPLGTPVVTSKGPIENVNITFYDCANQGFCGHMYGGEWVYEGAAACSWNLPIGTAFYIVGDPTQRIYVCKDRGLLDDTWVDIFWYHPDDGYDWQADVGRFGTIFIVYLP